jgi:hypothetical protein
MLSIPIGFALKEPLLIKTEIGSKIRVVAWFADV